MKFNIDKLTKNKILLIVSIILFLGTTYAWLKFTDISTRTNKIVAGNLELNLDDITSDGIKLINDVPKTYKQGMKTQEYTFTLTNNGSIESDYKIYLDDISTFINDDNKETMITSDEKLADNKIRYSLLKNQEVASSSNSYLLSDTNERVIDIGTINKNETISYSLRIWIDSKAENEVMGKIFNGKLRIGAEQSGTNKINSKEFEYHNDKSSEGVQTVEDALDDLYNKVY